MIYLDNSATTALCERAKQKMIEAMDCFGNPSSLHSVGYEASVLLDGARNAVAASLGIRRGVGYEIVFTGSGTEANNMALTGVAEAKTRLTSHRIITTDSEHPSILEPLSRLEASGFEIIKIPTREGVLDMAALDAALDSLAAGFPLDAAGAELEGALTALGEVDARTVGEDVIADIFSRFCVGK